MVQLQCIYANAHRMGNKEKKLEATEEAAMEAMEDLVAITEKNSGIIYMTEVLPWMAASSSEWVGKEGGAVT